MNKLITAFISLLSVSIISTYSQASALAFNSDECRGAINEIYENIEIKNITLKNSSFLPIYGNFGDSGDVVGYETWYSFNECKGNLVIHVERSCVFPRVYSTGNCKIEGIPSY